MDIQNINDAISTIELDTDLSNLNLNIINDKALDYLITINSELLKLKKDKRDKLWNDDLHKISMKLFDLVVLGGGFGFIMTLSVKGDVINFIIKTVGLLIALGFTIGFMLAVNKSKKEKLDDFDKKIEYLENNDLILKTEKLHRLLKRIE